MATGAIEKAAATSSISSVCKTSVRPQHNIDQTASLIQNPSRNGNFESGDKFPMPISLQNTMMTLSQNLSDLWLTEVVRDQVRAPFVMADGTAGFWGVHLEKGEPRFYEEEVHSQRRPADVVVRPLDEGRAIAFHPFRSLRPGVKQLSIGRQPDLSTDAFICAFGCQNPGRTLSLLTRAPIAQFAGVHSRWNVYPNAAPLHPAGHFIWVRAAQVGITSVLSHTRQCLTLEDLEDFLLIAQSVSSTILFFNSLHAGASVNHLHFQNIFHSEVVAIQAAGRARHGKHTILNDYPATGLVFDLNISAAEIWRCVELLQLNNIPFNLLAIKGCAYLLPRNSECEVIAEFPGGVFASLELAGFVVTGHRHIFETVTAEMLIDATKKVALPFDKFEELFGSRT